MNDIFQLLKLNKQIIFYGPPGTGKTYIARNSAIEFIENNLPDDSKEE